MAFYGNEAMMVNRETSVFSGFNGTILKEYGFDSTWDYFTGKRSDVQTRHSTNLTGKYEIKPEFWSFHRFSFQYFQKYSTIPTQP